MFSRFALIEYDLLVKSITAKFDLIFCYRFIGSAKVYLNDLASGQVVKSLPSKNLALVNESGQNIGVSTVTSFVMCIPMGVKRNKPTFHL